MGYVLALAVLAAVVFAVTRKKKQSSKGERGGDVRTEPGRSEEN